MKTTMKRWLGSAFAVAAAAGAIFFVGPVYTEQPAQPAGRAAAHAQSSATGHGSLPGPDGGNSRNPGAPVNAWFDAPASGNPPAAQSPLSTVSPLSTMSPPLFAADRRGKLVLNADTHANIEKLLLEENPALMRAKLTQVSKTLPPQARAELKVIVGQFQQYAKALTHTIPPDTAPETEQERLKLLDSLHTLRVSYLGAEAAQAMFGEEEATSRKLIGLMAAQNDPNLTAQQKADRALEILDKLRQPKPPPAG